MSPRSLAILLCVCATAAVAAGCAKKRAEVSPLPPVTIAKSYPGTAAVDTMRGAASKLRGTLRRRTAESARRPARTADRPVGTIGGAATPQPPRATSSIGHDPAPPAATGAPAARAETARDADRGRDGTDPLVALIVGGWLALLVLLPLAIKYGWRG